MLNLLTNQQTHGEGTRDAMASKNLEDVSWEELTQGATTSPDPKVERFVTRIQNLHMSHRFSHASQFLKSLKTSSM